MRQPVFRFAPSPNGRLHLGHAYSALLNEKLARENGGRLLLRIEDIDTARCTEGLVQHVLADLAWLGIAFEQPVRRQSQHMSDYRAALAKLEAMGLLYACSCTRSELGAAEPGSLIDPEGQPLYPQTCRLNGARTDRPTALRLKMDAALARLTEPLFMREDEGDIIVDASEWGDVILARKDIGTSYHLAVTVDDALQGITHIVRGEDMRAATSIHRLIQELLTLPHPIYHHHALIMHDATRKLAKSKGDPSLADLRADGVTAREIRAQLGFE
jgi:glutamyl-Q tRNA(Asp) synthetase